MEKRSKSISVVAMLMIVLLAGCYPQGPEYVEDLDVVITDYEPSYDFASKGTYAMPNKIVKITGDVVEGDAPQFIPDITATAILAQIDKNMAALGWQKIPYDDDPDVLLTPAAMETTTVLYYYDYWYWWYGGYYPYWGYPSYSTYSTGTLLMRMVDPDVLAANGLPVIQWVGAINGILTYSYSATRMNTALDRTFAQSPYLKTN
jgi:hypothetical protein